MVQHLIVHAGFHKTGTTTIQNTLAAHRDTLRPHVQIVLRNDMIPLCETARGYSISGSEFDLGLVAYEAAYLAESWQNDTIILSSEDLMGHMPGRHGLTQYSAAPSLSATMTQTWQDACPGVEIVWLFTTRAADPWLTSCHVQHLRAGKTTLTAAEYACAFKQSANLEGCVEQIRKAVAPADVRAVALETHQANLVEPLLSVAQVPLDVRVRIKPRPAANTSPSTDKITAMLNRNRAQVPRSTRQKADR